MITNCNHSAQMADSLKGDNCTNIVFTESAELEKYVEEFINKNEANKLKAGPSLELLKRLVRDSYLASPRGESPRSYHTVQCEIRSGICSSMGGEEIELTVMLSPTGVISTETRMGCLCAGVVGRTY